MGVIVNLYSKQENEIYRFLKSYNNSPDNIQDKKMIEWKKCIYR